MEFAYPWVLLLLLLLPVIFWARRRRRPGAVAVPAAAAFARLPRSLRLRLLWLPGALRLLALALLIVALARPREGREQVIEKRQGVALEMVLDRSSSMDAEFRFRGRAVNRLDAAKAVFRDFVMGGGGLPGRPHDLVGMVAYARYADTVCPLTLAHEALPQYLDTIELAQERGEDGTAIGDALALAAARLFNAEKELAARQEKTPANYAIKSKVVILLTDGIDNCSRTAPEEAAKLCREWGVKVYTVAVGGESRQFVRTPFGNLPMGGGMEVNAALLQKLAQDTGGRFFQADDGGALAEIYRAIDALEKTEIEAVRYADWAERFGPFALAALVCLALEFALRQTWLRVDS